MSGGKLVQDITNHGGHHTIRTHKGDLITVNSTHHQMQRPSETARILAVADPIRSQHYHDGDNQPIVITQEIEVVYYPNINAIGCQYHPEWLAVASPAVVYLQECIEEFLLK
jgi:GMP synthase-like glutamine amidotransferase